MADNNENKEVPDSAANESQEEQKAKAEQGEEIQQEQPSEEVGKEARMWAMLCHLLGLFTCFIAPLIIWLIKKDEEPFVDNQGKEALNFQITVAIGGFVAIVLIITVIGACIGIPLLVAVGIVDLIFCIVASVKANSGEAYRYPVSIRFVR